MSDDEDMPLPTTRGIGEVDARAGAAGGAAAAGAGAPRPSAGAPPLRAPAPVPLGPGAPPPVPPGTGAGAPPPLDGAAGAAAAGAAKADLRRGADITAREAILGAARLEAAGGSRRSSSPPAESDEDMFGAGAPGLYDPPIIGGEGTSFLFSRRPTKREGGISGSSSRRGVESSRRPLARDAFAEDSSDRSDRGGREAESAGASSSEWVLLDTAVYNEFSELLRRIGKTVDDLVFVGAARKEPGGPTFINLEQATGYVTPQPVDLADAEGMAREFGMSVTEGLGKRLFIRDRTRGLTYVPLAQELLRLQGWRKMTEAELGRTLNDIDLSWNVAREMRVIADEEYDDSTSTSAFWVDQKLLKKLEDKDPDALALKRRVERDIERDGAREVAEARVKAMEEARGVTDDDDPFEEDTLIVDQSTTGEDEKGTSVFDPPGDAPSGSDDDIPPPGGDLYNWRRDFLGLEEQELENLFSSTFVRVPKTAVAIEEVNPGKYAGLKSTRTSLPVQDLTLMRLEEATRILTDGGVSELDREFNIRSVMDANPVIRSTPGMCANVYNPHVQEKVQQLGTAADALRLTVARGTGDEIGTTEFEATVHAIVNWLTNGASPPGKIVSDSQNGSARSAVQLAGQQAIDIESGFKSTVESLLLWKRVRDPATGAFKDAGKVQESQAVAVPVNFLGVLNAWAKVDRADIRSGEHDVIDVLMRCDDYQMLLANLGAIDRPLGAGASDIRRLPFVRDALRAELLDTGSCPNKLTADACLALMDAVSMCDFLCRAAIIPSEQNVWTEFQAAWVAATAKSRDGSAAFTHENLFELSRTFIRKAVAYMYAVILFLAGKHGIACLPELSGAAEPVTVLSKLASYQSKFHTVVQTPMYEDGTGGASLKSAVYEPVVWMQQVAFSGRAVGTADRFSTADAVFSLPRWFQGCVSSEMYFFAAEKADRMWCNASLARLLCRTLRAIVEGGGLSSFGFGKCGEKSADAQRVQAAAAQVVLRVDGTAEVRRKIRGLVFGGIPVSRLIEIVRDAVHGAGLSGGDLDDAELQRWLFWVFHLSCMHRAGLDNASTAWQAWEVLDALLSRNYNNLVNLIFPALDVHPWIKFVATKDDYGPWHHIQGNRYWFNLESVEGMVNGTDDDWYMHVFERMCELKALGENSYANIQKKSRTGVAEIAMKWSAFIASGRVVTVRSLIAWKRDIMPELGAIRAYMDNNPSLILKGSEHPVFRIPVHMFRNGTGGKPALVDPLRAIKATVDGVKTLDSMNTECPGFLEAKELLDVYRWALGSFRGKALAKFKEYEKQATAQLHIDPLLAQFPVNEHTAEVDKVVPGYVKNVVENLFGMRSIRVLELLASGYKYLPLKDLKLMKVYQRVYEAVHAQYEAVAPNYHRYQLRKGVANGLLSEKVLEVEARDIASFEGLYDPKSAYLQNIGDLERYIILVSLELKALRSGRSEVAAQLLQQMLEVYHTALEETQVKTALVQRLIACTASLQRVVAGDLRLSEQHVTALVTVMAMVPVLALERLVSPGGNSTLANMVSQETLFAGATTGDKLALSTLYDEQKVLVAQAVGTWFGAAGAATRVQRLKESLTNDASAKNAAQLLDMDVKAAAAHAGIPMLFDIPEK